MHVSPTTSSHSLRPRGPRAESSSSGVTYDIPTTPVDLLGGSDNGNLGEHFSVLKMKNPRSVHGIDPFDRSAFGAGEDYQLDELMKPLPTWLEGTISALGAKHPLRLLLPAGEHPCEEPDPSILRTEPDAVTMLVPEESPFAFATSTESPCVTKLHNAFVSLASGLDDVRPTLPPTASYQAHASSLDYDDMVPSMVPFSTPGPTFTQSTPHGSTVLDNPSLYPDHRLSESMPLWQLGPSYLPCDDSTVGVDTERNLQTSSPTLFADESCSDTTRHPLSVRLPFSTPGPSAGLPSLKPSTYPSIPQCDFPPIVPTPRSGASPFLPAVSPWRYDPLRSPLCLAGRGLASRSNSFGSTGRPLYSPGDVHMLSGSIISASEETCNIVNIDYEALGFRWNRFDRGDIILDAGSSSPIPGESDSEELFWQQQETTPMEHALPRESALNSSPASLRLTGISTPPILSPRERSSMSGQVSPSRPYRNPSSRQSVDNGPFAWVVASSVERVPSTPCSDVPLHYPPFDDRSYRPNASVQKRPAFATVVREPTTPRHVPTPPSQPSDLQDSETTVPELVSTGTGKHFAPAPGIYISPLQNQSTSLGDSARTKDHHHGEGVRQMQPNAYESGRAREGRQAAPPPHERAPLGALENATSTYEDKSEEDISQSHPKTVGGAAGVAHEDEDEIEDFTTDSSQETHDTIESWTD
ncbi:hypothetical protein C8Q80DRAFT_1272276 [Daedaleopsis nitida]|nr:hypothetical protein C8Q80DRAFT_1272276 [Daedaleopsis nitida]